MGAPFNFPEIDSYFLLNLVYDHPVNLNSYVQRLDSLYHHSLHICRREFVISIKLRTFPLLQVYERPRNVFNDQLEEPILGNRRSYALLLCCRKLNSPLQVFAK